MRRRALQVAGLAMLALTLLCGVGSLRVWSGRGTELVMGGARDPQIERRGVFHLHITYQLPPRQSWHDLRAFLRRQGWKRISFSDLDRETVMTFVRPSGYGRMREIMVITMDRTHRNVDMQVGRCATLGTWVNCI